MCRMYCLGAKPKPVRISEPYGFLPVLLVGGVVDLMEFGTLSGVPQVLCSLSQRKQGLASTHVHTHPESCICAQVFPISNASSVYTHSLKRESSCNVPLMFRMATGLAQRHSRARIQFLLLLLTQTLFVSLVKI
jgi:hypothetical protein